MKYKLLIPGATVTVPVDFKLDNFMLREAMRIFKFSRLLSQSICSDSFMISLDKNYAKNILEMSRPDIFPALYAKLLTHQLPTSASVERSFLMLKSMIHENRNFSDAHCTRRIL